MKKLKIQYISDLHLEHPYAIDLIPKIQVKGDILILSGDNGDPFDKKHIYESFLMKQVEKGFKKVFFIAGNHEFYENELYESKRKMQEISEKDEKLEFFDKRTMMYNGVRFIGTTLWSDIKEENKLFVKMVLQDCKSINVKDEKKEKRKFVPEDAIKLFKEELEFVKKELEKAEKNKETVVVFTHHAPLNKGVSEPKYEDPQHRFYKSNCAFVSDLKWLIEKYSSTIHTWIFGHTHYTSKQIVKGVNVVSNQCGYVCLNELDENYDPNCTFEVSLK